MISLADAERAAATLLEPAHYDFFAGGADDERTLRSNVDAFDRHRLLPRVLRGVGKRDLGVEVLGQPLSMPVMVAPTAFHRLAHPDGEVGTARAAAASGTVMILSMAATQPVEQVAATGVRLWFQMYVQPDRAFTERLVRRVEAAGCAALVVSVDSPVFGRRLRDLRHDFGDLPAGLACENMRESGTGPPRAVAFDAALDWSVVGWLRGITTLPIVLKGILHPDDARLAVGHGADAVIVSNHGGRQLDGAVASIDALPAVVEAVGGRLPVLLDGGVRRGTDVVTALALGAAAVAVGRPVLWGLTVAGEHGVRQVLELLRDDLDRAMVLCGADRVAALTRDVVHVGRCSW
ncbi:alpha-hydroxy acid oxidase [Phytohabitans sp. ZYX-F-186]|uniref:Alpha-hydroxy acid oxidase n=1 Tax=Phytohabitans maris TaxID=3071409 RepID=A0ABU0ZWV1_9ACTN|nr:alpha-hydroxy acid oxidase [Phytohabitans sp. ZYX-F-186]MDQ7911423.1 alpha-hydroxy acid oxidase [Phytohabitans sp. ZYX-F-186]